MIYKQTFQDGFTQSEFTIQDECMFKWNKKYNERLDIEGYYRMPLIFGTAWHKFQETLFKTKKIKIPVLEFPDNAVIVEGDEDKLKHSQAMLGGMAMAYAKFYKDEVKLWDSPLVEKEISIDYKYKGNIINLKGKIDRGIEGETLYDSKSTSMLRTDILAKWDFKFQFMFYLWLSIEAGYSFHEFVIDAVKKPQIRPHQQEPLIAYERRVESDMLCKPKEYFYRNTLNVTSELMENFEKNILFPKLDRLLLMEKSPNSTLWLNKNTEACHHFNETCPYFPICSEGGADTNYITRKLKHTEYNEAE